MAATLPLRSRNISTFSLRIVRGSSVSAAIPSCHAATYQALRSARITTFSRGRSRYAIRSLSDVHARRLVDAVGFRREPAGDRGPGVNQSRGRCPARPRGRSLAHATDDVEQGRDGGRQVVTTPGDMTVRADHDQAALV